MVVGCPGVVKSALQLPLKREWPETVNSIDKVVKHFMVEHLIVDSTGMGDAVADMITKQTGISTTRFSFNGQSKTALLRNLDAWITSGRLRIPTNCPGREILKNELMSLRITNTRKGIRVSGKKHGGRDDVAMALGLALWGFRCMN